MKYQSSNILRDFEFHDALFTFESFDNEVLTVAVRYLNIHKSTEQNQYPTDMEIELARITFHEFCAKSFEPGRAWRHDENGEFHTDEPQVIHTGTMAKEKLLSELRSGTTVFEFGVLDNGNNYLDGCGEEPWFQAQFTFDSAIIEWSGFRKKACYEERSFKKAHCKMNLQ